MRLAPRPPLAEGIAAGWCVHVRSGLGGLGRVSEATKASLQIKISSMLTIPRARAYSKLLLGFVGGDDGGSGGPGGQRPRLVADRRRSLLQPHQSARLSIGPKPYPKPTTTKALHEEWPSRSRGKDIADTKENVQRAHRGVERVPRPRQPSPTPHQCRLLHMQLLQHRRRQNAIGFGE